MKAIAMVSCLMLALSAGLAWAETAPSGRAAPDTAPATAVVAQAATPARSTGAREAAPPAEAGPVPERVTALEKESVVLREDLGKARLDARSELEAVAKRQAEAIERLHKELAETQAKLEAERAAQAKRNQKVWLAIGVVALAALFAD
jgi:hypothetical protein